MFNSIMQSIKDSVTTANNKTIAFFKPIEGVVKDSCQLVAYTYGAVVRDIYLLGGRTANLLRDFNDKPVVKLNVEFADELETITVNIVEAYTQTVSNIVIGAIKALYTVTLLISYLYDYVTNNYASYDESKSIQYFLFDESYSEDEAVEVSYEEVIEQTTNEVETITNEIKLLNVASNELIEASDTLITKESSTQQVVYHDTDEETYDDDNIEITNIDEFTTAVENKFMSSALSYVSANDKTIQYNAKQGKRCRKGYRRVGDACVLISYLELKSLYTV